MILKYFFKVFISTINFINNPNNINLKLISYITKNLKKSQIYSYAPSYEEFVKLIKTTNNLEELKELDYRIMVELFQSTMLSNLKKNEGTLNNHISQVVTSQNATKGLVKYFCETF